MPALEVISPVRWVNRPPCASDDREDIDLSSIPTDASDAGSSCIRGFLWALAIEGIGLVTLAGMAWGIYSVRL